MSNLKALHNQLKGIRAQFPSKPATRQLDASLFTEQEQEQLIAFAESLPRPLDLRTLNNDQLDERRHWIRLEKALYEGDMAEAEKLRRRYGGTLSQLMSRFLSLNISALPTGCNEPGPHIQEDGCIYGMSRASYRYIVMEINMGRGHRQKDAMWRWIDFIEKAYSL